MTDFIDALSLDSRMLLTSILTSISCGLIGVYIVIRRLVFISGGITHASFGGIGIAYFAGISPVTGAAIFAVLSALGIEYSTKHTKLRNDSAIGMLWSVGMALGIIFIYITPGRAPNLISYLFGSILTVSSVELAWLALLNLLLLAVFFLFHREIHYISFDAVFGRSRRFPVNIFNYIMISLVAITIVLNIRVAGIILIISLLTIPQNIMNLYTHNFSKLLSGSVVISFVGITAGIRISEWLQVPTGATIIFTLATAYLIAWLQKTIPEKIMATKGQINQHR